MLNDVAKSVIEPFTDILSDFGVDSEGIIDAVSSPFTFDNSIKNMIDELTDALKGGILGE